MVAIQSSIVVSEGFMTKHKHKYSIVIATRNRSKALELSIPMMLNQSRPPAQFIIVDSSDDPEKSRKVVEECASRFDFDIEFYASEAGTSKQRNYGLDLVKHEVVLFPDDDSLLFDGAMEEIMAVYDHDTEGVVGGVCSAEANSLPEPLRKKTEQNYTQNREDKIRKIFSKTRFVLERNIIKNPFIVLARQKMENLPSPEWLEQHDAIRVEWASGFRMSFRTPVIRSVRFDEDLGRYAAHEDVDASLGVLDNYLMIGARRAQIYHYKSPERRDKGYTMGVILTLNMAYVIAKRSDLNWKVRYAFWLYGIYKLALYSTAVTSKFGRQRWKGAFDALRNSKSLFKANPDRLPVTYLEVRKSLGIGR